jgi:hypothetical protein
MGRTVTRDRNMDSMMESMDSKERVVDWIGLDWIGGRGGCVVVIWTTNRPEGSNERSLDIVRRL